MFVRCGLPRLQKTLDQTLSDDHDEPLIEMREMVTLSLDEAIVNEKKLDSKQATAVYAQHHGQDNFPEKINTLMPKLQKITDNKYLKKVNRQYYQVSKHFNTTRRE